MNPQPLRSSLVQWSEAHAAQALSTWLRLLSLGAPQRYGENVVLFSQGDPARELFLLASGILKLTYVSPNGQESLLALRYRGQFAEQCAYDLKLPYPVTGTTIIPCEIHRFEVARMVEAEQRDPEVNAFERYILKRDLYNACVANIELKTLPPTDLLEHVLWEIAASQGVRQSTTFAEFVLPLDNNEMAECLGMSATQFKQTRTALEDAGRLRREHGKRFVLLRGN